MCLEAWNRTLTLCLLDAPFHAEKRSVVGTVQRRPQQGLSADAFDALAAQLGDFHSFFRVEADHRSTIDTTLMVSLSSFLSMI